MVDSESGQTVELVNNFPTFYKMLPPQMPSNAKTEQLKNSTKTATKAVLGIIILQFLLAYFTSYSLNALWGMMNGLNFIVYLPMINLTFPSNFYLFNKYIIEIATFDIVPKIDEINEYFFSSRYSEGPIIREAIGFEMNDYVTQNFLKNVGSLYIFAFWIVITSMFFKVIRYLALRYYFVQFYMKYRMNEYLNASLMRFAM